MTPIELLVILVLAGAIVVLLYFYIRITGTYHLQMHVQLLLKQVKKHV